MIYPAEDLLRVVASVIHAPPANASIHVDNHYFDWTRLSFLLTKLVRCIPPFVRTHPTNGVPALLQDCSDRLVAGLDMSPYPFEVRLQRVLRNCWTRHPRKSKPACWPSTLSKVCVILVFVRLRLSPKGRSHSVMKVCVASTTFRFSCRMTKSSAYNTSRGCFLRRMPSTSFPIGKACSNADSKPVSAMLAINGLKGPPCGVPLSVGSIVTPSITPEERMRRMTVSIIGHVSSFFSIAV